MSNENDYSNDYDSYETSGPRRVRTAANENESRRPSATRRRAKTPQSINGLHRRRRRKISW